MNNYAYVFTKGTKKYKTILEYSYPSCQLTDLTDDEKNEIMTNEVEFIKTKCGRDAEVTIIPRVIYDMFAMRFMTRRTNDGEPHVYDCEFHQKFIYNLDTNTNKIEDLKTKINDIRIKNDIISLGNKINDYICNELEKYRGKHFLQSEEQLTFKHYYKIARILYEEIFIEQFVEDTQISYEEVMREIRNTPDYHKNLIQKCDKFKEQIEQLPPNDIKIEHFPDLNYYINTEINRLSQKYGIQKNTKDVKDYSEYCKLKNKRNIIIADIKKMKGPIFYRYLIYYLYTNCAFAKNNCDDDDSAKFRFFLDNEDEFFILFNLLRQMMYFSEIFDISEHFSEFSHMSVSFIKTCEISNNHNKLYYYIIFLFNHLYNGYVSFNKTTLSYEIKQEKKQQMRNFITNKIKEEPYKYYFNYIGYKGNGEDLLTIVGNVLIYELFPRKNVDANTILLYRAVFEDNDDIICETNDYMGRDINKTYSLSFNTSIMSGAFFDITACTLHYMINYHFHFVYYIKKTFAEDHENIKSTHDEQTQIRFNDLFYVPPLTPIEQLLGAGEFWHTRTKSFKGDTNYKEYHNCGIHVNRDESVSLMSYLKGNMEEGDMKKQFKDYLKKYRKNIKAEMLAAAEKRRNVQVSIDESRSYQSRENAKRKVCKNSGSKSNSKSSSSSSSNSNSENKHRKPNKKRKTSSETPDPTKIPSI